MKIAYFLMALIALSTCVAPSNSRTGELNTYETYKTKQILGKLDKLEKHIIQQQNRNNL